MAKRKNKNNTTEYAKLVRKLKRYRNEISVIRYDLNNKTLTKKQKQKLFGMLGGRVSFMRKHSLTAHSLGLRSRL